MYLNIVGHHMNNGESLECYVKKRMSENIRKYFQEDISAEVIFLKDHNKFKTSILIKKGANAGKNNISGHAIADDIYTSFNMAMSKSLKQLKKKKSKAKNYKRKNSTTPI